MPTMKYNGVEYKVIGFIQDSKTWEYFMLSEPNEKGEFRALVDGYAIEEGPVNINDLTINVRTRNISTDPGSSRFVLPVQGGEWV